jgi:RHS repeat-associated protein
MIGTARPASWPPRKGLSASRSASDTRGHISVSPETGVFGRRDRPGANRELAPSCYRATCPHRPDSHQGRRRFSGRTRGGCEDRARYYQPGLGRSVSEDPIRFRGGDWNLYAYVRNNPVRYKDPRGLCSPDYEADCFPPPPGPPGGPGPLGGRKDIGSGGPGDGDASDGSDGPMLASGGPVMSDASPVGGGGCPGNPGWRIVSSGIMGAAIGAVRGAAGGTLITPVEGTIVGGIVGSATGLLYGTLREATGFNCLMRQLPRGAPPSVHFP